VVVPRIAGSAGVVAVPKMEGAIAMTNTIVHA
jgi:hypothetical protein